jgi:hypothetical protein
MRKQRCKSMPRLDAKQMAEIRARRGPLSDPRNGRLLVQIDHAFTAYNTDVLSASVLIEWCYGGPTIRRLDGEMRGMKSAPSWQRANVRRAALKICTPIGRSPTGTGRPMLWKLDPAKAALRGWRKRHKRLGLTRPPWEG